MEVKDFVEKNFHSKMFPERKNEPCKKVRVCVREFVNRIIPDNQACKTVQRAVEQSYYVRLARAALSHCDFNMELKGYFESYLGEFGSTPEFPWDRVFPFVEMRDGNRFDLGEDVNIVYRRVKSHAELGRLKSYFLKCAPAPGSKVSSSCNRLELLERAFEREYNLYRGKYDFTSEDPLDKILSLIREDQAYHAERVAKKLQFCGDYVIDSVCGSGVSLNRYMVKTLMPRLGDLPDRELNAAIYKGFEYSRPWMYLVLSAGFPQMARYLVDCWDGEFRVEGLFKVRELTGADVLTEFVTSAFRGLNVDAAYLRGFLTSYEKMFPNPNCCPDHQFNVSGLFELWEKTRAAVFPNFAKFAFSKLDPSACLGHLKHLESICEDPKCACLRRPRKKQRKN